jgi:hypothetical protein
MIQTDEVQAIVKSVAAVMTERFGQVQKDFNERVAALHEKIKAIPAGERGSDGRDGKDADPVDIDAIVEQVTKRIPTPQNGKDASIDEVKAIISEEVAKAVAAIPPAKDGTPGRDGRDAEPIHPDTLKLLVIDEVSKAVAAIPKAQDGKDGQPGRDALEIDILPAIDPTKSYPRGTFAKHVGGLFRSIRQTTTGETVDLNDWDVIIEGETRRTYQNEDQRSFTVETVTSSGRKTKEVFSMPVMIHRGVYRPNVAYEKGDTIQCNGNLWHCEKATQFAPGHTEGEWTLIVRRGQDGKK